MATLDEINADLDRLAAAQAAVLADVANVQGLVVGLTGQAADLQAQVVRLETQIASGAGVSAADLDAIKARVAQIADGLVGVDQGLDAIAPDPVEPPAPPAE